MTLCPPYRDIPAWLIDMDGVIYRGSQRLPAADRFIAALQRSGSQYLFLTNNATKTPEQVVARLQGFDIHTSVDHVYTSAMATAATLLQRYPLPGRVLVVGGQGIQMAVKNAGYEVVTTADRAELVVTALDQQLTYAHLAEASLAINGGCPWLATNADPSLPTERGDIPGAGAIIALLSATTDRHPQVIGKPERGIFELALQQLGVAVQDTVMLGDRLTTDIAGGHAAGLRTICVLTGIANRSQAETFVPRPDWIIDDLSELLPEDA